MSEPHHYHGKTREITKPLIAMDYMNMKPSRESQSDQPQGEEADSSQNSSGNIDRPIREMPILAIRDRITHFKFAHVVPRYRERETVITLQ